MIRSTIGTATLLASLVLGGCPAPPESAPPNQPPPGPRPEGGPAGGAPPNPEAGPTVAERPESTVPKLASFEVNEGEGVKVSGTISYAGERTGVIRIDFMQKGDGDQLKNVHALNGIEFGEWTVEAPKNLGDLLVVGYLDKNGNGSFEGDPAGAWSKKVKVGTAEVTGIDLVLTDDPDLSILGPPPETPDIPPPVDNWRPDMPPVNEGAKPAGEGGDEGGEPPAQP